VNPDSLFRHSAQEGLRVGPVLDLLTAMTDTDPEPASAAALSRRGASRTMARRQSGTS
jgi:hypothetical protein